MAGAIGVVVAKIAPLDNFALTWAHGFGLDDKSGSPTKVTGVCFGYGNIFVVGNTGSDNFTASPSGLVSVVASWSSLFASSGIARPHRSPVCLSLLWSPKASHTS